MNGIIATLYDKRTIGINNTLPWNTDDEDVANIAKFDLSYFAGKTRQKKLVMGWNTWESFCERPLKNREEHIVITLRKRGVETFLKIKDCKGLPSKVSFMSLEEFRNTYNTNDDDLWVIGGAMLYNTLLPECKEVFFNYFDLKDKEYSDTLINNNLSTRLSKPIDELLGSNYEFEEINSFISKGNSLKICKFTKKE